MKYDVSVKINEEYFSTSGRKWKAIVKSEGVFQIMGDAITNVMVEETESLSTIDRAQDTALEIIARHIKLIKDDIFSRKLLKDANE